MLAVSGSNTRGRVTYESQRSSSCVHESKLTELVSPSEQLDFRERLEKMGKLYHFLFISVFLAARPPLAAVSELTD